MTDETATGSTGERPVDLRRRVFESLDHAVENGYLEVRALPPAEVADDLCEYAADLADADPAGVERCVREWQATGRRG